MSSDELAESIQFVARDARDRGLEYLTVEHLVLVLLDSRELHRMRRTIDADLPLLRQSLERFLREHVTSRPAGARSEARRTPGFERVLNHAVQKAHDRRRSVSAADVLEAIYSEPESYAARVMNRCGLTKAKLNSWTRNDRRTRNRTEAADGGISFRQGGEEREEEGLATNLTAAAQAGRLDAPHPRQAVIDATLRVLCRKYKGNPVLVGPPGVGKTAIVHSLAHLSAQDNRLPKPLAKMRVHEVNVSSLVAGTKYRGDFEARLKKLIATLTSEPGTVLFIDEIHTLIGAGSASGSTLDASNILKPALADGRLRCIGATTSTEFARVFERDSALARRFQRVDVPEPDPAEAATIIGGFIPRLESHHGVAFAPGTVPTAVRLANRFLTGRSMPDKAIDLLDETAAAATLAGTPERLTDRELGRTVARLSGMPEPAINRDEHRALKGLEHKLTRRVFGQDEAASELAHAVRRARLGLTVPGKPVGSFLFAGPTGVGKTEMARTLAEALGYNLLRFDMSEHMERHSVSRLIGAPPGYVGFEQGGQLTERVGLNPHCVLLLDEIEKAHPDIFNVLLQVMDHGKLTDNAGATADFRHVVLVMTTNAGADAWDRQPLGFDDGAPAGEELGAVNKLFTPEFRNRLDRIIRFAPLDDQVTRRVVKRELDTLTGRLASERGYTIKVSTRLRNWLASNGFSRSFGARPLLRLITSTIVDAIVAEETRQNIAAGTTLHLDCNADGKVKARRTAPAK